jgi:hypothetical protein
VPHLNNKSPCGQRLVVSSRRTVENGPVLV